jgi:2-polyprenyl-6-methoxyphenol hydroxylase-like FAD-dependent oxidoreductase
VLAQVTGPTGTREIRAHYVAGADGGHSFVRQAADIPFEGDTYARSFILADVLMEWPLDPLEVTLFFSGQGLVVVAPLPGGHHRVVATVDQAPMHPAREDVQALLDARGPHAHRANVREVVWSSRFHVHHRVARSFRSGRLLLAGDAAHVHSPAGGQGMNTGIQDAMELADALAQVLRGADEATTLDAYAHERREVARRIVGLTDRMTRAATLKSPLGREVRNAIIGLVGHVQPVRRRVAITLAELRNGRRARAVPR